MNRSKAAVAVSQVISTVQLVFGVFFLLTGVVGGLGQEKIDLGVVVLVIVLVGGGLWLVLAGSKRKKLIKSFKQYVSILSLDSSGSIANLALATKAPEETVIKNLQTMIHKKYFASAYIDMNMHCVILPNHVEQPPQHEEPEHTVTAGIDGELITVVCKSCGGVNQVEKYQMGECEYCGSALMGI